MNRVILGTAAAKNPAFAQRMAKAYGSAIAVGVDARDGRVAVSGWLETMELDAFTFCKQLRDRGVSTVIFTDIAKDGALQGTSLSAYQRLLTISDLEVVASGGVSTVEDLRALRTLGVQGAIVGRALYEGRMTLEEALAAAEGRGPA